MYVYVIRHGESETNKAKKWTGWLDVHLTDKGKDDAKKAGNFLKRISFDKILYLSDTWSCATVLKEMCLEKKSNHMYSKEMLSAMLFLCQKK